MRQLAPLLVLQPALVQQEGLDFVPISLVFKVDGFGQRARPLSEVDDFVELAGGEARARGAVAAAAAFACLAAGPAEEVGDLRDERYWWGRRRRRRRVVEVESFEKKEKEKKKV